MSRASAASQSLKVAVVSDVHAYDTAEPDKAPSYCCVTDNDPTTNPLAALIPFIRTSGLKADILLCPGDIGDKANPLAVQHVWHALHEIKKTLEASQFATTTGNHDVDSRYHYNQYDGKGMLQALHPAYPFDDDDLNDRYWSRHFVIINRDFYRILVLNSSAFHGEGRCDQTKAPEYERGRVSTYTLTAIRQELDGKKVPHVNILLCHHHPHQHSELRLGENDLMLGGQVLLELLDSGNYGQWLVLHGHKHHPKLEYAAGGSSSPIIFAAGSLAAALTGDLQTGSRNQFYMIELPYSEYTRFGFVGRFQAWDWLSGHGWRPAPRTSRLPATGGFGWRENIDVLAKKIRQKVRTAGTKWAELTVQIPELQYLLPRDLEHVVQRLRADPKLTILPEDDVPPTLIGRIK